MNFEKKIVWLTVGTIVFGLWALNFIGIFIYAATQGVFSEGGDTVGFILTLLLFLIFGILPAFLAWKCFTKSRHLSRKKSDEFTHKKAFE